MKQRHNYSERGESLVSMIVAMLISGIVLSASTSFFINSLYHSRDIRTFTHAQVTASSLLDLMSFELRMLGSGMPLTQASFSYQDSAIGALALPVSLSASTSEITFRLNETGATALLTGDFAPSSGSRTLAVDSAIGFNPGDSVYLSSFLAGGTHGLHGIVASTSAHTIQLASFTSTPSAYFPASSLIQPVSEVSYTSSSSGTVRTASRGASTQVDRTSFELRYLDRAGQALPLPLSAATIRDSLAGITVIVKVESRSRFGGFLSSTEAQQTVALRNLILSR